MCPTPTLTTPAWLPKVQKFRNERLLPGDELLVIGTDDQLAALNAALNTAEAERPAGDLHPDGVALLKFAINAYSPLVGDTVRNSGLREEGRALVVGIERDGQRLLNPDGTTVLAKGDVLWVAGDRERIKAFMSDGWGEAV